MTRNAALSRRTWLDRLWISIPREGQAAQLVRERSRSLDELLFAQWHLGRDILLAWCPDDAAIHLVVAPHYRIAEAVAGRQDPIAEALGNGAANAVERILAGRKRTDLERLHTVARLFDVTPVRLDLPFRPGVDLDLDIIEALICRYGISLVNDRAVALFDAVGFSLVSPFEQVTQLNSLSYSVNAAYAKLLEKNIDIKFARSTTGDGYYIWNRVSTIRANLDLYHFMHLVMADNAIARGKSNGRTVPFLRTCFHVGSHYEFFQAEGLNPTTFSFIVGDVTIVLARMIACALPGQVLIGDFQAPMFDPDSARTRRVDAVDFIRRAGETISNLQGVTLSGDEVVSIRCYLTGPRYGDGSYGIARYRVHDKHGHAHQVYNAKVNIYRRNAPPIFLGLQHQDLDAFRERHAEEILHFTADDRRLDAPPASVRS